MRRFILRPEEREPHRFEQEAHEMSERLAEAGYDVSLEDLCLASDGRRAVRARFLIRGRGSRLRPARIQGGAF